MKIKSFIAQTVQEALLNVKREMGESSLILETRNIDEDDIKGRKGQNMVEVVAAENLNQKAPNNGHSINDQLDEIIGTDRGETLQLINKSNKNIKNDLPQTLVELYLKIRSQQVEKEHAQILIKETLSKLDEKSLGKKDLQLKIIKEIVARKIKVHDSNSTAEEFRNAMAFVGLTGVGKTTTILKMALDARKRTDKKILFISIKGGSVEKLNKTAKSIGAKVEIVTTSRELRMLIDQYGGNSVIFIDTPGINHFNNDKVLELKEFILNIPNVETHLVLNATTRYSDIVNVVENITVMPVKRLLFTKMDETNVYGTLLSAAMATNIPLSYVTNGQNIYGGIEPVTTNKIAEMLIY